MHLSKTWQELKRGEPGRRFQSRYERRASSGGARKWLLIAAGALLMLLGLVFLPLPGPGLLIIAAGALLVAEESLSAARALDWVERKARRAFGKLSRT
jgi:hypothetical protein